MGGVHGWNITEVFYMKVGSRGAFAPLPRRAVVAGVRIVGG